MECIACLSELLGGNGGCIVVKEFLAFPCCSTVCCCLECVKDMAKDGQIKCPQCLREDTVKSVLLNYVDEGVAICGAPYFKAHQPHDCPNNIYPKEFFGCRGDSSGSRGPSIPYAIMSEEEQLQLALRESQELDSRHPLALQASQELESRRPSSNLGKRKAITNTHVIESSGCLKWHEFRKTVKKMGLTRDQQREAYHIQKCSPFKVLKASGIKFE